MRLGERPIPPVFVVEMEAGIEDDYVGLGATQVIEFGCGDQCLEWHVDVPTLSSLMAVPPMMSLPRLRA